MEKSISIVGCGIKFLQQITSETLREIKMADVIFTLVADPLTIVWLREQGDNVIILNSLYSETTDRKHTYYAMVDTIINSANEGNRVCVVSYGHPGVFAFPLHETVRQALNLGINATMYPSVSAEDCLFADLNVDPGSHGCLSYEATDFLIHDRPFNVYSHLILWQIGVIAVKEFRRNHDVWNREGVVVLSEYLLKSYNYDHSCIIYEASIYEITLPKIIHTTIGELATAEISAISTLYVPPTSQPTPNFEMMRKLKLISNQEKTETTPIVMN